MGHPIPIPLGYHGHRRGSSSPDVMKRLFVYRLRRVKAVNDQSNHFDVMWKFGEWSTFSRVSSSLVT
ncbi:hypothetical protein TNCV_3028581 [Trichonephila clavipes]|nr:hypothetical protein TNCV_3028581 [Trichonephila clavipes]